MIFVADFETSYCPETQKSWVWAWGSFEIFKDKFRSGGNISSFMEFMFSSRTKKCYFHNLKFDGKFILYWLLSNNYKYVDRVTKPNEYSHLIDDTNNYYDIVVGYEYKGKTQRVTFLDSFKKLPSSLDKIAKDFDLGINKLSMDYDKIREENYIEIYGAEEEREYLKRDCEILKKAIEITEKQGMSKMTIGSNALADYKMLLDEVGVDFDRLFPTLYPEVDEFMRNAYKGGCTMVNSKYQGKIVNVHSYDVNSMYPAMLYNKPFPYGRPIYYKGKYKEDKLYNLYIQHIRCEFSIKPNHFPCIQIKNTRYFAQNEWLENSDIVVDLYLTNIDLELFFESYNVYSLEYIDGYKMKSLSGMFRKYIDKWYTIKSTTTNPSEKAIAKLYLNSLYGKFGTRDKKSSLTFMLDNDIIKRKDIIETEVNTVYLPVAIYTTSYARCYLLENANKNFDDFIYCDTDSIHLTKEVTNIPIDNKKLGYFKHEYSGKGKYLKQKCYLIHYDKEYIKEIDGKIYDKKLVCAGLNQNLLSDDDLEFDNFYVGREYKKLKLKNVKGGCHLALETHKIV